jgi:hypothetical protein
MTTAVIGALRVILGMDSAAFEAGADAADRRIRAFQRSLQQAGQNLQRVGSRLTLGVTVPLMGIGTMALQAARESEQASAAVAAALASMGDGAGYTQDQLEAMAGALADNSLFQDDQILAGVTANLLTFGNVSGDVFARAQQMALDLSARLGTDLQGSAIMLGKALNDPITGISALSEAGVSFTDQQKEQIRAMAEAGNVAGAQAIILGELERQYAGQAAALAGTDSGQITQAWNEIGEALEAVGDIILPIMADFAGHVKDAAEAFQALDPDTQKFIVTAGLIAGTVGPALISLGLFLAVLAPIAGAVGAISLPVLAVVAAIGALTWVVWRNWETLKEWLAITIQFGSDMIDGLGRAFQDGVAFIQQKIDDIWTGIKTKIDGWITSFYQLGVDMIDRLKDGIQSQIPTLTSVMDAVGLTVNPDLGALGGVASDAAAGLEMSPEDAAKLYGIGESMGDALADGARDALDEHSPSRVFAEIGRFAMAGLGLGVEQGTPGAVSTMTAASNRIADQMREGTAGAFDGVTDSLDALNTRAAQVFEGMGRWMVDLAKGATTLSQTLTNALGNWSNSLGQSGMEGLGANLTGALGGPVGGTLTGILGGLMGFKDGGAFQVGGAGGIDSQIVAFRASPNETVSVTKPGQDMGGPQEVAVRVYVDRDGNWQAAVAQIADASASARVQQAGRAAYQQNRRGG